MSSLPITPEEDEAFGALDATLTERGKRYGKFKDHANITQQLVDRLNGIER